MQPKPDAARRSSFRSADMISFPQGVWQCRSRASAHVRFARCVQGQRAHLSLGVTPAARRTKRTQADRRAGLSGWSGHASQAELIIKSHIEPIVGVYIAPQLCEASLRQRSDGIRPAGLVRIILQITVGLRRNLIGRWKVRAAELAQHR
jgi:hypothetical protein